MNKLGKISVMLLAAATSVGILSSCGSSESDKKTVKFAYQATGDTSAISKWMKDVKAQFESENKGATLKLEPIKSNGDDYGSKLALMSKSEKTAPDLMILDTEMIRPYVAAGYLKPIDDQLKGWKDWSQYFDSSKNAGKADDGKIYAVPLGTDTRGIWYNKDILKKAGLSDNWQPKSWDDVIDAATKIKKTQPDVIPMNLYAGRPLGEVSVMQGFDMLLYGTKGGTLYNTKTQKWVTGSKQFKDSLQFIKDIYSKGLAPSPQQALDPQLGDKVGQQWIPQSKLGMSIEGNWLASSWMPGGDSEWTDWQKHIGWCGFPTQNGQKPGLISMSGGWGLALSSHTQNPDLAFKALKVFQNEKHAAAYDTISGSIAVRKDVEQDKKYLGSNPTIKFFTDLANYSQYRPANSQYKEVSDQVAIATESVLTGQKSVKDAAAEYDSAIAKTVGADHTEAAK